MMARTSSDTVTKTAFAARTVGQEREICDAMFSKGYKSLPSVVSWTLHVQRRGDAMEQRAEMQRESKSERPMSWVLRLDKLRPGSILRVGVATCPMLP
jgi:hypothetical protein